MATWKKVIVSGSTAELSQLNVNSNQQITAAQATTFLTGSFTGSFYGDGSQLTGIATTLAVSSSAGNVSVNLASQALTIQGTSNEVTVSGSGQTITVGLPTNVTIGNNLTVTGDLTVNGTTTTINTANLLVEDKFILLSSGSLSANDGGIIVQSATGGVGYAFYFDSTGDGTAPRWSMAEAASSTATTLIPTHFVGAITGSGVAPSAGAPTYGFGTMHVNNANGDIYIYA